VVGLVLTPTASLPTAPAALPEPTHTEIEENTLLVPAESGSHNKAVRTAAKPGSKPKAAPNKPAVVATKPAIAEESAKKTASPAKTKAEKKAASPEKSEKVKTEKSKPETKSKKSADNRPDIRTTRTAEPSPAGNGAAKNKPSKRA
jgi:cell division protein FtsI (penicillin-binding protein 3)